MKKIIIIITAIFFTTKLFATNYYFSASGNDVNIGTSQSQPYKTITKLNTLTLVAGDSILFKCGDVFRGQISLSASGNASNTIVFSSYSTGKKPIISGAEIVTSWTQNGTKYEATITQKMYNFFVNDKEQIIARYPNERQYLTLDSAKTKYLKDASLTGLSSSLILNSKVCIHTAQWCWEKTKVASLTADKLAYTDSVTLAALAQYSYFLYDNINHLDTANEWKYDTTSFVLSYIPPTGINLSSNNCEASVYTNGIQILSSSSYITIKNISFEKQSNSGVFISSTSNRYIKILNCDFARQYNHAVNDKGKYNEIGNCSFREVDGIAVYVNGGGSNLTVHHNNFRNIGQFRNSGIGTQINLSAIKFAFVDSCYAHHNDIDSTGYCGISADGGYHIIEKNIVKNAMLLNNDGAALKSFAAQSHHIIFRNNFVSNSDGNTEGTYRANFITPAIYFDFNVNNCTVQENTIYNHTKKGIFQNSGNNNNSILGNVVHGSSYALDFNGHQAQPIPINGMIVKNNSFFVLDTSAYCLRQIDFTNNFNYGIFDSNYYYQPYSSNKYILRYTGNTSVAYNFSSWQAAGNDVHTKTNNFSWAIGVDSSKLFMNPTDNTATQDLQGFQWKDLGGNIVTNLILQPWTSKILIKTATLLPVEIVNYEVRVINEKQVLNSWVVANEINLSHYNIQRSSDGKNFETVGTTTITNASRYSFLDKLATNYATLYYRIEAIDKDGSKTYSTVKQITIKFQTPNISIYPNPARNYFMVECSEVKTILIVNYFGSVIYQKQLNITADTKEIISCQNFAKGLYIVKFVLQDEKIITKKLLID